MEETIKFLFGLGCVFFIGFLISLYGQMTRLKNIKKEIISSYGKEIDISEADFKSKSVSSYFRNKKQENIIDDITWNDLGMDDIFKKINNTRSTAGNELLYDILRRPLSDSTELRKRDNLIEYFRDNPEERFNLQYALAKLGKSNDLYTTNCLFNEDDENKSKLLKYRVLSKLPLISLILIFVNKLFIFALVASLLTNVYISLTHGKTKYDAEGFGYIIRLINTARNIKNMKINELDKNLKDISYELDCVKKIRKKQVNTDPNSMLSELNMLSEYFNMLFLEEFINYEKVKNTIIKNAEYLKVIYEYVGTIDALISVASYRDSLNYFTTPNLIMSKSKEDNILEFLDIYHPLIKNPVSNSGQFNKSALITGSNASGKSTFIKTIAINAIISQSIFTSCAREYNSSYFNIYTSMALKDDILSSESYYIVEIKSLKRILDNINKELPSLCFVDEILRGTNTVERISSSCEVLNYMVNGNCICFAATHDIELTHLLEDKYDNYHFEENISNNDIKFDYKLHEGRAESRNAIKLLGFIGYDKNIVRRAEERAEKFILKGKWESEEEFVL